VPARLTAGGGDLQEPLGRVTNVSVSTVADPLTAFEVFTAGMGRWWQRCNPLTGRYLREVSVEGFVGGGLRGKDERGEDVSWGVVLTWEPGAALVFDCIAATAANTTAARTGTVSVRFTGTAAGITLVEVIHERFAAKRSGLLRRSAAGENGYWTDALAAYTAAADRAVQSGVGAPAP
jgi:hypothetical protein